MILEAWRRRTTGRMTKGMKIMEFTATDRYQTALRETASLPSSIELAFKNTPFGSADAKEPSRRTFSY